MAAAVLLSTFLGIDNNTAVQDLVRVILSKIMLRKTEILHYMRIILRYSKKYKSTKQFKTFLKLFTGHLLKHVCFKSCPYF